MNKNTGHGHGIRRRIAGFVQTNWLFAIAALAATAATIYAFASGDHSFLVANGAVAVTPEAFKELSDRMQAKVSGLETEVKNYVERLTKGETISGEQKGILDKGIVDLNGIKEEVARIAQKMAAMDSEAGSGEKLSVKSYGTQLIESDEFKEFETRGKRGNVRVETKAITTATGASGLLQTHRENDIVSLPRERLTIADLITVIPTKDGTIEYMAQTVRTNNARGVAETTAKPYSDYQWVKRNAAVVALAHLAKLSRQALDDVPRLRGEVDSEMRYGLGLVKEMQILYGTGTGDDLQGIMPLAAAYNPQLPAGVTIPNLTRIDILRLAMLQNALALFPADGIVLNPIDWTLIELTKRDDDGNGGYLFAQPQGTVGPRLWGLPIVSTPAMEVDNFLVGNFALGSTLYQRMGVEVLISTENVDDFEKNMATMRAEERLAQAVKRPKAFTKGEFSAILTP